MDNYTPFGYLDNPWHCARLNPSGVLRSEPAVGFAWHCPGLGGHYTRKQLYRAALRVAPRAGDRLLLTHDDFASAGIAVVSRLHSKDIMSFDWSRGPLLCHANYFLHHEHALCCLLSFQNQSAASTNIECALVAEYQRDVGASSVWDAGLLARPAEGGKAAALLAYPEGEAFALAARQSPVDRRMATSLEALMSPPGERPDAPAFVRTAPGPSKPAVFAALAYRFRLAPGQTVELLAVLGRGATERRAAAAAEWALDDGHARHTTILASEHARQGARLALSGDWPAHWRRGFAYDAQTVAMVVRPPAGIYHHPWDGMQAHSPRAVLAEAALDALLLAYATPDKAKQVLLGVFADAPAANVPCTREDGSYNMIAEDGEACGTAPEWCFPLFCVDLLYRRTADRAWLARLYPYLARYLDWWLRHRSDAEGWLHYHCSWESGQDDSPRFGPQASGGTLIGHIRPVDLHAAVAHGAAILCRFAAALDRPRTSAKWQRLAAKYRLKTQAFWQNDWYWDYDTRAQAPVPFRDAMHLTPLLAEIATPEQRATLRQAFTALPPHGTWSPLEWPPVVFSAVEAAAAAGWYDVAAKIAAEVVERVYRACDARQHSPGSPLPGVAMEHWGGTWGCEGYGWGALSTLLVVRHVVGWREEHDGTVTLRPEMPADWLTPGRRFEVGPLHHQGRALRLSYRALSADQLGVEISGAPALCVRGADGQPVAVATAAGGRTAWSGSNGRGYRIEFAD